MKAKSKPTVEGDPSESTVLVVDDNPQNLELLQAYLEELQCKVISAEDGVKALECVAKEKPDLILLDLKLPGIDGFEVLRQIKNTDRIKRIPVIILTSSKEEGDRAMGYDCGANSYLVKPISFDGFIKVVQQVSEYWLYLNVEPPIDG